MVFNVSEFGLDKDDLPPGWMAERLDTLAFFNPDQIGGGYPHSEIAYLDIANVAAGVIGNPGAVQCPRVRTSWYEKTRHNKPFEFARFARRTSAPRCDASAAQGRRYGVRGLRCVSEARADVVRGVDRASRLFSVPARSVYLFLSISFALAAGRVPDTRRLLEQCRRTRPHHPLLPALERLMAAQRMLETPPRVAARDLARLSTEIEPAAARVLGVRARDFLVPHWRRVAAALDGNAFDPQRPELHASFAAARAEEWATVNSAVEAEVDWKSHLALIFRHAQAAERLGESETALADWCRLCWDFPHDAACELVASR